jgi:hypothetical protein
MMDYTKLSKAFQFLSKQFAYKKQELACILSNNTRRESLYFGISGMYPEVTENLFKYQLTEKLKNFSRTR